MNQPIFLLLTLWAQLQAKVEDRARGQTFVEYGFIIIFVGVAVTLALTAFAGTISTMFSDIGACLNVTQTPTC